MSDYIYASAKIRALEKKILDKTDIERMVDAPDFATAFKVLNDTDYADNLSDLKPENYRQALSRDYQQLYQLFKDIIKDSNLFKLIFLERDLVNIKLLFKALYFNVEVDEFLKENCVFPSQYIKEFVLEDKNNGLDEDVKDLILTTKKQIKEDVAPDEIDSLLTQNYFILIDRLSKKIGNVFISGFIKISIDNANILTWIRARELELIPEKIEEKLISGGNIEISSLIKIYTEDIKSIRPILLNHYNKIVAEACDDYCERGLLFEMERVLDDYKINYAQKAKMISSGPEVIFAYHLAKQNAVANIRIIMTGKFNKMPGEEIKKTLRQPY